jgi:hypothetical protein
MIREETTRAGSNELDRNEGVGEHVRTRFHSSKKAGAKLRTQNCRSAPNEENPFLLRDRL